MMGGLSDGKGSYAFCLLYKALSIGPRTGRCTSRSVRSLGAQSDIRYAQHPPTHQLVTWAPSLPKSVNPNRRILAQHVFRRESASLVDFAPLIDADWRGGQSADRFDLYLLREIRPGDHYISVVVIVCAIARVVCKSIRSGKDSQQQSCS
jgi:hypothetical protein